MTLNGYEFDQLLKQRGVMVNDKQSRSLSRDDLAELIAQNGDTAENLEFRGMDFTGADLRGLRLEKADFTGCNFKNALTFPMVNSRGKPLTPGDLAYTWLLRKWETGEMDERDSVEVTSFAESFLTGGDLSGCNLSWVDLSKCFLDGANLENSVLYKANLSGCFLRWVNFRDADLRNTDFRNSHLLGARLETSLLGGIQWDPNYRIVEELEGKYADAIQVYRTLKRVHENAGELDRAGQFHYREERCRLHLQFMTLVSYGKNGQQTSALRRLASGLAHGGWKHLPTLTYSFLIDQLFGFGERPHRVIRAAALVIVPSSFAFIDYSVLDLSGSGIQEFLRRFGTGLYFSATSFTALGYGSWVSGPDGWAKYFGVLESFAGVFLLALFLVTFTRRWTR